MCHEQCCRLNHYGMEYSPGSQIIINILCCGCRILLCSQHTRRLSVCLKPPKCLKKLQVSNAADNSSYSFSWMLKFISRFGRRSPSSHLKGWSNEKKGLKGILLFERTFEVIKIGFYSCRVFGFVWYVHHSTAYTSHWIMTFGEIRNITEVAEQNLLKLCMCVYVYPLLLKQQTFERFNWISSKTYLIS